MTWVILVITTWPWTHSVETWSTLDACLLALPYHVEAAKRLWRDPVVVCWEEE